MLLKKIREKRKQRQFAKSTMDLIMAESGGVTKEGEAPRVYPMPEAKVKLPAHLQGENLKNKIVVIPIEARGVAAADLSGRSDPYCKVFYGTQTRKTNVVKFHRHPVWPDDADPSVKEITFQVWDQDAHSKDDFLGRVVIPLPIEEGEIGGWFTLNEDPKIKTVKIKGKLHVQIYDGEKFPALQPDPAGGWSLYNYQDLLESDLRTGDVVLFSGTEWISTSIKKMMHTPYSHCGMVLVMPNPRHPQMKEEVFLIEADWDDKDYFQNSPIYGVIVNRFEERMHQYDGDVIWHIPLAEMLTQEEETKMIDYLLELKRNKTKYDLQQGITMMLKIKNKEDGKSMFCSELVASALKHIGKAPPEINSSMMGPYDVAKLPCLGTNGINPDRVLRYQVVRSTEQLQKKETKLTKKAEKAAAKAEKAEKTPKQKNRLEKKFKSLKSLRKPKTAAPAEH